MKSVYGTSLTVLLVHLTELHLVYSNANTMYSLKALNNGNIYFFTVHKASSIEGTKNDRRVAVDYIDPGKKQVLKYIDFERMKGDVNLGRILSFQPLSLFNN